MKEEINNEDFIKELVRKSHLESPSEGFTLQVMQQIEKEVVVQKLYTPLITKKMWLIITVLFAFFLSIAFYFLGNLETKNTTASLFQNVFQNSWDQLFLSIRFSKSLSFSLVLFFIFSLLTKRLASEYSLNFFLPPNFCVYPKNSAIPLHPLPL